MTYWTARKTSTTRWTFEDGWTTEAEAEKAAAYYRREYRRRCVVVPVREGQDHAEALGLAVFGLLVAQ